MTHYGFSGLQFWGNSITVVETIASTNWALAQPSRYAFLLTQKCEIVKMTLYVANDVHMCQSRFGDRNSSLETQN